MRCVIFNHAELSIEGSARKAISIRYSARYTPPVPLPPILEIYVLWHPLDELGKETAERLMSHFRSPAFAGLAGGAVEVYVRSTGWERESGPPRPMPFMEDLPHHLPAPQLTAVVPVLGIGLARAIRKDDEWQRYLRKVFDHGTTNRDIGIFPIRDPKANLDDDLLKEITGKIQALALEGAKDAAILCREVAQSITQHFAMKENDRIVVFVSHTKHESDSERDDGPTLYDRVCEVIAATHLRAFFDAADLQPGTKWAEELRQSAGRNSLLILRTDKYSSRDWCQKEILIAKENDLPMVTLHSLSTGDDRGSFLMDNIPTIPNSPNDPVLSIHRTLNRLVDESLKKALWDRQLVYLGAHGFDWLPGHAPEPVTVAAWLTERKKSKSSDPHVFILHPDPPLGPEETRVIVQLCALAGYSDNVEILTPRTFAARGGELPR